MSYDRAPCDVTLFSPARSAAQAVHDFLPLLSTQRVSLGNLGMTYDLP